MEMKELYSGLCVFGVQDVKATILAYAGLRLMDKLVINKKSTGAEQFWKQRDLYYKGLDDTETLLEEAPSPHMVQGQAAS